MRPGSDISTNNALYVKQARTTKNSISITQENIEKLKCSVDNIHMSHFSYACKMWYPLNLMLEKSKYLWFYWTFCIVILHCGLKLHKLLNHTLVMLQKWLEIH